MANSKIFNILLALDKKEPSIKKADGEYYAMLDKTEFKLQGKSSDDKPASIACKVMGVSYQKEMYKPCSLEVELLMDEKNIDSFSTEYKDVFLGAKINIFENDAKGSAAAIAKNYFIYSVSPRVCIAEKEYGYTVILKACSPDKQLDINKYCATYYNEDFGSILEDRASKVSGLDLLKETKNGYLEPVFPLTSKMFVEYDGKKDDKSGKLMAEFKQPYMVQYNETFYQFLVRIANRCGQHVYFENGKFVYGVRKGTNYTATDMRKAEIEYPQYNQDFYGTTFNSKTVWKDYLNASETAKSEGYNEEIFDTSLKYNIDLANSVRKGVDVITDGIKYVSAIGAALQGDSLTNVISNGVAKGIELSNIQGLIKNDLDSDYKSVENTPTLHNATLKTKGKTMPFSNKFYDDIRTEQIKAEKKKVIIRFKQSTNIMLLGDTFDNAYTAIEVKARWYYKKGDKSGGLSGNTLCTDHTITCIEKDKSPYLEDKRILRSSPQKATIADTKDPLYMGRVRIKYHWDYKNSLSPWIRVCVPAAYKDGGFMFTPAVDDDVMVDYEDGNIERPFVVGYMHNKDNRPYYGSKSYNDHAKAFKVSSNPGSCCITNQTGQSITLNNGSNKNKFVANMLPGALKGIGGMAGSGNEKLSGSIILTDAYGVCTISSDTQSRCITLDSALGKIKLSAFDGITVSAPNGDIKLTGKNITLEAGNNVTIKSGGNKGGLGFNTTPKQISAAVTKAAVNYGGAKNLYCTGANVVSGLLDVSFIRAALEIVLRPLEGTTMIKTPGFILLSSGKGGDVDTLRKGFDKDHWGWGKLGSFLQKKLDWHDDRLRVSSSKDEGVHWTTDVDGNARGNAGRIAATIAGGVIEGAIDGALDALGANSIEGFIKSGVEEYANASSCLSGPDNADVSGIMFSEKSNSYYDIVGYETVLENKKNNNSEKK